MTDADITPFLTRHTYDPHGLTFEQIVNNIPAGWRTFADLIWETSVLCEVPVTDVRIHNAILYFDGVQGKHYNIFYRVAKAIMGESGKTCMGCGKKCNNGRRKIENPIPALCAPHYLEFLSNKAS